MLPQALLLKRRATDPPALLLARPAKPHHRAANHANGRAQFFGNVVPHIQDVTVSPGASLASRYRSAILLVSTHTPAVKPLLLLLLRPQRLYRPPANQHEQKAFRRQDDSRAHSDLQKSLNGKRVEGPDRLLAEALAQALDVVYTLRRGSIPCGLW